MEVLDLHGNGLRHLECLPRNDGHDGHAGYVRHADVTALQQNGWRYPYLIVAEEAGPGIVGLQALAGRSWTLKLFLKVVAIGAVVEEASVHFAVSRTYNLEQS